MNKYFYSVMEMKFNRAFIMKEGMVSSGGLLGELVSSRLVGGNIIPSAQEFIEECESKGLTRRPLYYKSEESLGDVFVYDEYPNTVLGLYRFEVERPGEVVYIFEENLKLHSPSHLFVERSEPITNAREFIERNEKLLEEYNEWDTYWHDVRHVAFFIGRGEFEKALPFPHNVGLYIEDKEKGLGR